MSPRMPGDHRPVGARWPLVVIVLISLGALVGFGIVRSDRPEARSIEQNADRANERCIAHGGLAERILPFQGGPAVSYLCSDGTGGVME